MHEKISLGFKFYSSSDASHSPDCPRMKHTIRDRSCVETSAVASGKNVNWCCNIPANVAARDAPLAGASPNNLRNIAGKRGVGLNCEA
jgi:hypothetical protein